MDENRIVQRGDVAKFKVTIRHEDFDMIRDDFRVQLHYGMMGGSLVIEKSEMVVDEDGDTFMLFDTSDMTGWVKAYCIYEVPDTDFATGTRQEVDIQWLCFVSENDDAKLCCDKRIVTVGHVVYERTFRGDVNTLYLNLRTSEAENLVDVDGKQLRVRKTDEVEKGNFTCLDENGYVVDSGYKPSDFVQSSTMDGYATKAWVESQGYLSGDALDGYATEAWVESQGYLTSAPVRSVNGQTGDVVIETAAVQSDWDQTDDSQLDYIKNKPTIPAAQVQSDWDATTGMGVILNKPTIPTVPTNVSAFTNDAGYLTAHQDISGKEDKLAIESTAKTANFNAEVDKYYTVNVADNGSVTITLPNTGLSNSYAQKIVFLVTLGTGTASCSFSNVTKVADGFSLDADATYEVNALYNGSGWYIAAIKMVATT